MTKNLVIVESPAKAKTIHKFLGKDYQVEACMGHIRDLPKTKLGVDVDDHFSPHYQIIPEKKPLVKELQGYAQKAKQVFLATDLDREGEAIAWHLREALELPEKKVARVIFNEITCRAIQAAFANHGQIQMNKVYAQQARRILDRLVGYRLSPLLWEKIARGLSAGRVQSVAVKFIVDKEKEIQAFVAEEYWEITALVSPHALPEKKFKAKLKKAGGKKITIANGTAAQEIVAKLKDEEFRVAEIISKEKLESPPPPFTTSQLQQQASIRLRFRTQHTMQVAQQLYEGLELGEAGPVGLITYMRTDSVRVSEEAIQECREFIGKQFSAYLPDAPRIHKSKKDAQEAHEAIRPSSVQRTPEAIKPYLNKDQYLLYRLIWERFVASQMKPARYALTTVNIAAREFLFESKGKQVLFPGYTVVTGEEEEKDEESMILPPLQEQEILNLHELNPSQHFTQPPPRYTEATLVKILEAKGIGRPSTYAPIITTIQDRGYVKLEDRKFWATELGIKVTESLDAYFATLMDVGFTADMETKLDEIEEDKTNWENVLRSFYGTFSKDLEAAYEKMTNIKKNPEVSPHLCQQCGEPLIYRYNKQGKFLGCSKFPECKYTVSLDAQGNPLFPSVTEYTCEKCGRPLIIKHGKLGKFLACSGFPECANALPIGLDGKPVFPQKTDQKCQLCGAQMIQKQGPRGPFLACSRYPECKNTVSLEKELDFSRLIKETCDKCNKPMTLRKGPKGFFLGCTGYPECKNIKRFSPNSLVLPPELQRKCALCQSPMTIRSSHKGLFWGCSNYPKCKGVEPCNIYELATTKQAT